MRALLSRFTSVCGLQAKQPPLIKDEERLVFTRAYSQIESLLRPHAENYPEIKEVLQSIEHVILAATDPFKIGQAWRSRRTFADLLDSRYDGAGFGTQIDDETVRANLNKARDLLTESVFNPISALKDKAGPDLFEKVPG